jgi:DNA-binding NarL/FixJ family response regulator
MREGVSMRVLIADDQPDVRSALRLLLQEEPGISAINEVTNCRQLLDWVQTEHADLLVLDWELPGANVSEFLPDLRDGHTGMSIVILNSRPQTRKAALAAGADDFVCKGDPPEHLLSALRECCRRITSSVKPV